MKSRVPYRLIAYHAQQCAEKSLKAYLVYHDVDFPYTHNISHLVELGTRTGNWGKEMADAEELTPFAVSARYPGEEEDVTKQEALRAVSIAGTVRRRVLDKLLAEGLDERLLKHLK
jgi:HEPN domain-containing protein